MPRHIPMYWHLAAAIAIVAILPSVVPSRILAIEILIFALAAIGCNLLLGFAGLLSFGQALFFGIGAYAAGLLSIHTSFDLVTVLVLSSTLGAIAAGLVGFVAIRRKGIYFVMLTLAFAQLGYYIAFLADPLTGGEDGLLNVRRPILTVFGLIEFDFASDASFYFLVATVFVLAFVFLQRLADSYLGSVLVAIKQNEARVEAIGYQARLYKIAVFAFSGAVTALAGALYAFMLRFAPLSNIDIQTSQQILFMSVLGGLGSLYGSVLGALLFLLANNIFSELWPRWMLLFGLLLILVMLYLPGGLSGAFHGLFNRMREARVFNREKNNG